MRYPGSFKCDTTSYTLMKYNGTEYYAEGTDDAR